MQKFVKYVILILFYSKISAQDSLNTTFNGNYNNDIKIEYGIKNN